MSLWAMMPAFRDITKKLMSLNANECEITPEGKPFPSSGDRFFAVHCSPFSGRSDLTLDELFSVNLTISLKGTHIAYDRWGPELLARKTTGLLWYAGLLSSKLHMNYEMMDLANSLILEFTTQNGYEVPLQFKNADVPTIRGGDWWLAEANEPRMGMSITLYFGDANRIQTIEDEE